MRSQTLLPATTSLLKFLAAGAWLTGQSAAAGGLSLVADGLGSATDAAARWQLLRQMLDGGPQQEELSRELAAELESQLAQEIAQVQHQCAQAGNAQELLGGVVTEVSLAISDACGNRELVLAAVRQPEDFPALLRRSATGRRQHLESAAEHFFDRLLEESAHAFTRVAPGSQSFDLAAFTTLLDSTERLEAGVSSLHDRQRRIEDGISHLRAGQEQMKQQMDGLSAYAVPGPAQHIRSGSRPHVTADFVERQQVETLMTAVLDQGAERTALVGMRGSGKSQLASLLAQRCEEQGWPLVAWLRAQSRDSLVADLADLGLLLHLPAGKDDTKEELARRCLSHLASSPAADRLVVLDNVEDLDDLEGLAPRGAGLRLLATTTRQQIWQDRERVPVGVFEREESVGFLRSQLPSLQETQADRLADLLGDLPLALSQAAATIRREDCSFEEYAERLRCASLERAVTRQEGDEYPEAVAVALWFAAESALDDICRSDRARGQLARRQLEALSWLAASGVPGEWLTKALGRKDLTRAALADLVEHSVCQRSSDGQLVLLHGLQARVLREVWAGSRTEMIASAAAVLGAADLPQRAPDTFHDTRQQALALTDQLTAIAEQELSQELFSQEPVVEALCLALDEASALGAPQAAVCLEEAVALVARLLGPDHPDTLLARNNLAGAYQEAGRLSDAIPLYEQNLADRARVLGPDHPETLTSRNNLASAYADAGRLQDAVTLYQQNLTDRTRVLGPDHPHTLQARNNLAYAYADAGRLQEATRLYEQNLADRARLLGADHPDTLTARNNLAYTYQEAGRLREATSLYEQSLADHARVLGPDHPQTFTARNNLATAYQDARRLQEAISLHSQNLEDRARVLGPDHPDTLTSRRNLATAYREAGREQEAQALSGSPAPEAPGTRPDQP